MNLENHDFNIKTLRYYRKNRGYSQENIADSIRVNTNTVSRWERGETKISVKNQKRLAKLLGASLNQLREALPIYKEEKTDPRISSTISEKAKVALDIVSETYHINRDAIMDIAPFMFHALAAASLGKRAIKLDEMYKELEKVQELSMKKLAYIPGGVFVEEIGYGGNLDIEQDAINDNQLFFSDEHYIPDDVSDISTNPFSQFLKSFIDLMPEKMGGLFEIEWRNDELPRYHITDSYIREILLVPVDDDLLEKIMELILNGNMPLKDINYKGFLSGLSDEFVEENKGNILNEIKEKVMEKYTAFQTSKQTASGES